MIEPETKFTETVVAWLQHFQVDFQLEMHNHFALIKLADAPVVLDFRNMPYQKPNCPGFQFGVELFAHRPAALKSRLLSITQKTKRIFARNTTLVRETKSVATAFFENNHLGGFANAKFKYALVFQGEIVAMATFAQGRNFVRNNKTIRSFELIGFCQKNDQTVVGGLSKLINHFAVTHKADHIATTIDLDWAAGVGYTKAGFTATQLLSPKRYAIHPKSGKRNYPPRDSPQEVYTDEIKFPYINSGYQKFEHFYAPQKNQ